MKRRFTLFDLLNVIVLFSIVIVTLYPFLYMLNVSLSDKYYVVRQAVSLWPKGFSLDMYKLVLEDPRIAIGYRNTILYTALGTLIAIIFTSMGAFALSRKMVFGKAITMMIVFTMLFQGGMIPTFLVVKGLGMLDSIWAMVIPGAVSVWNLIIMRTFFQGMPTELIESGKIDGLTDIGVFLRIILPLSQAVLATISLFYAVALWNNFQFALLYLRSADLFPLTVVLRNIVLAGNFQNGDINGGGGEDAIIDESLKFATIIVTTLPIILVYPFIQKYFVKGVMIGSVKG